jgi:hypothetical protein
MKFWLLVTRPATLALSRGRFLSRRLWTRTAVGIVWIPLLAGFSLPVAAQRVIYIYRRAPSVGTRVRVQRPASSTASQSRQRRAGRSPCGCPYAPHGDCQSHGGCNTASKVGLCGRGGSYCHRVR